MKPIVINLNALFTQKLNYLKQEQFTGELKIQCHNKNIEWHIYFCLGRIVWGNGGYHPHRCWLRALVQNCPQIKLNPAIISGAKKYQCWRYRLLITLSKNQQITQQQFSQILQTSVGEIIFDILQQEQKEPLEYLTQNTSANYLLDSGLKISELLLDINIIVTKIQKEQQNYLKYFDEKLVTWSPHLAPSIKNLALLKQAVNPDIYQKFLELINGRNTLRDLAVKLSRELALLNASLIPLIQQELLELVEIDDLPEHNVSLDFFLPSNPLTIKKNLDKPLIACIDDSPSILHIMKKIILNQGYRFLGIQTSLKAIPTLITHKPDLIFLDVGMPIVNGYEISSQLKRISQLKDLPIIMLTGQDTVVDRLKAKISGTSQFITKPIDINQIVSTMSKFLTHT